MAGKKHYFWITKKGDVKHAPSNAVETLGEEKFFARKDTAAYISTTNPNFSDAEKELKKIIKMRNKGIRSAKPEPKKTDEEE